MNEDRIRSQYDAMLERFAVGEMDAAEPVYCAACGDEEVAAEGDVCGVCRESKPEDWLSMDAFQRMRRLII